MSCAPVLRFIAGVTICFYGDSRLALDTQTIMWLSLKLLLKLQSFQLLFNHSACSLRCPWPLNHLKIANNFLLLHWLLKISSVHHISKYHVPKLSNFSLDIGQRAASAHKPTTNKQSCPPEHEVKSLCASPTHLILHPHSNWTDPCLYSEWPKG